MFTALFHGIAKRAGLFSFLLVVLLTACSGGSSEPYTDTIDRMTASIQQQLTDSGATGGVSVALVDDQEVVWVKSFGYADAGSRIPATPDTTYRIASVTKAFTGTMVMQLSDQGLLDIGDPLTRFIPTFSIKPPLGFAAGGPITIRSILTHHSGIPGDIDNGVFTAAPDPDFNTKLVTYLQNEYLAYPTDVIMAYSNSAISLLATVIANASGQSFQACSDAFFQTLGMDNTSVSIDSPKVAANLAKGYQAGQEVPRYYNNGSTTGAIVSTTRDMAKFIKMVHAEGMGERGLVLRPATLEAMLTPQNGGIPLDFDNRIGLIWFLNDADLAYAGRLCYHNGANMGFRSHLEILRDHKLGVVVLANDEQVDFGGIARQILKAALREKTGLAPPNPPVAALSPPVAWVQARLDALQGIYLFSGRFYDSPVPYLTVRSVPGALEWTNPDDGTTIHIVPKANGWLSAPGSQATEYEFSEVSGRKVMIRHSQGQTVLAAEYYEPPAIPAAWTARLGTYRATNWNAPFPAVDTNLIVADGMLGFVSSVLVPLSDTLAYVRGLSRTGGSSVQVLSIPPDGHEELQLLGVRYRKN
jgi:CubicO group peptidase (beta-lactamase class C family)